jgi:cytochrome oxidase Cu insertion factor (SCO1/SenC/PrrC family)
MTTKHKAKALGLALCLTLTTALDAQPVSVIGQTKSEPVSKAAEQRADADFTLTDHDGHVFRLSQLRGKVVLLFFGYTSCPDACPTTMAKLSRVYKLLGPEGDRVVTLFVSVDPNRDTPHVLKDYLKYFKLNALGLTGSKAEIDAVVHQYGARYEIEQSDSAAGYHINHSTDLYLLNQAGQTTGHFNYADGAQVIADGVRRLLH